MRKFILILILAFYVSACVESIDNSVNGVPTIEIYKPADGDTVQVGKNRIYYEAFDADGLKDNLSHFEIFINGKSQSVTNHNHDTSITALYLEVDENMIVNNKISYYILVYDKRGSYKKSTEYTDVFVDQTPATPDGLTLIWQNQQGTVVNLVWNDNATNETAYEVWRKDGKDGKWGLLKTLPAGIISTNDNGLLTYVNYYYKVRATNSHGASKFSNEVNSKGIAGGDAPSDLKAEPLGATSILLTWKDNSSDELGFFVEKLNPNNGKFEKIKLLPSNTTEYIDQNLVKGNTYRYRVAAYTSESQSAYSNEAEATTAWQDVPAPSVFKANYNEQKKRVVLTWQDRTNQEIGTYIERKTGLNGTFKEIGNVGTDITVFYDSTITPGNTYYYRARHYATAGHYTPYSNITSIMVPVLPPNAPTDLKIIEFTKGVLYGLTWKDNSDDETGFELQRKEGENGTFQTYKVFPSNTVAFNDSIQNPNQVYFYRVRSYRDSYLSDFSNVVSTTGQASTELGKPTNLIATYRAGSSYIIDLSWNDNSTQEFGFIIERKEEISWQATEFEEINRVGPNVTTYKDDSSTLAKGKVYIYRVRAYNAQNESDNSNEARVEIPW